MSFSKKVQEARMSYTFDDFLLSPNASYVEPKDIDTTIELGYCNRSRPCNRYGSTRWCRSNS